MRPLLLGELGDGSAADTSFAVLRGLYWLAANVADRAPLLVVVDDAPWADEPSLRWLAHLVPRLPGLNVAVLVALRPGEPTSFDPSLAALRAEASSLVRPGLLSEAAVGEIVRDVLGAGASDTMCEAVAGIHVPGEQVHAAFLAALADGYAEVVDARSLPATLQ